MQDLNEFESISSEKKEHKRTEAIVSDSDLHNN